MASYDIQNAPQSLGMRDFKSTSEKFGSLAKSCRFAVVINTPQSVLLSTNQNTQPTDGGPPPLTITNNSALRELTYLCEATEFPGRGFNTLDLKYYGPNFKIPFQTSFEDINMTFLCRTNSMEREIFDNWMQVINPASTFNFEYKVKYQTSISLYQFAEYSVNPPTRFGGPTIPHKATYEFTLYEAFPVNVNPQPVTWADDGIQRLTVTFSYSRWLRKGNPIDKPALPDPGMTLPDLVRGKSTR